MLTSESRGFVEYQCGLPYLPNNVLDLYHNLVYRMDYNGNNHLIGNDHNSIYILGKFHSIQDTDV